MDSRRQAYLDAMGIERYVLRHQPEAPIDTHAAANDRQPMPEVPRAEVDVGMDIWLNLAEKVASCKACDLHQTRTQTVLGTGNPQADLLIIGEAPGAEEDRQGEPFVGRAGQLLDAMLRAIGLDRKQVYIANILKCRPPGNRNPSLEEATACQPFLEQQINLIKPKRILAMGAVAAHNLLAVDDAVGRLRGKQHQHGPTGTGVRVTYHPAYLLRSPEAKAKAWQDLQQLMGDLSP